MKAAALSVESKGAVHLSGEQRLFQESAVVLKKRKKDAK